LSKKALPLAELKRLTFPDIEKTLRERFELERRIQQAPALLSQGERHGLIGTPFLLLSPKVDKHFSTTNIDKEVGISIVVALACDGLIFADTRMGEIHLDGGKNDESESEEKQTELRHELQASSSSDDPSTRLGDRASVQGHAAW
jgi:hypothetical protein